MMPDYTLYTMPLSYYSGKARAYLRRKNVNWQEQLASPEVYKNLILPNVGAGIIPVLETAGGEVVQDTTAIIDFIEARHPQGSVYPQTPRQRLAALLLEVFGDEWLLLPAMHYRWNFPEANYAFLIDELGRARAPQGSQTEREKAGESAAARLSGLLPILGVNEITVPAIEAAYTALLADLNQHFLHCDYLLGARPSIGDYGLLGPLYAHLGRDPYPKALMQERAPAVYAWVERMNSAEPAGGEFLAGDEVPETLMPLLTRMFTEQVPYIWDVIDHNDAWLAANPGGDLPRVLGMTRFKTGKVESQRLVNSFSQWMFQRPLDYYQSAAGADRRAMDALLEPLGGVDLMRRELKRRVKRKPGQLELVEDHITR